MPAYSSTRRRSSPALVFVLGLMLFVVGGGGLVAGLWALGVVELPFLRTGEPSREGWVLVPISARPIPAYNLVLRDDLINPQKGLWNEQWVPQAAITPNMLVDRTKIIGRVMEHEKMTGYAFTEADFLPKGTRPGLVAGIPPGKRSLTLEATKITGIHALRVGDRFDIVGTLPLPKNRPAPSLNSRGAAALSPLEPEVRVLVRNGAVVSSVRMRAQASTSQSLLSGPRSTTKPVEEVVIALEPEEIPELTAAMTLEATITVVARSGHPDDAAIDSVTPDSNPPPPPTVIETVVGEKRETIYFAQPMSEKESAASPQRPVQRTIPRGKPRPLRVATSEDAAAETEFAPLKPGVRVSPMGAR